MSTFDFAVVGAGMAGASLAWQLAADGACCCWSANPSPATTPPAARPRCSWRATARRPIRALTRASRAFYEAPPPGFRRRAAAHAARRGVRGRRPGSWTCWTPALWPSCAARPGRSSAWADDWPRAPCLRREAWARPVDRGARDIDVHALHQGYLRGLRAARRDAATNAEVAGLQHDADGALDAQRWPTARSAARARW